MNPRTAGSPIVHGHAGVPLRPRALGPRPHRVGEFQRARILGAAIEVGCERGLAATTVGKVIARAGVSRRTFYEQFSDRDDCLLALFDQTVERAAGRMRESHRADGSWAQRIRAGLLELLLFVDAERELVKLCAELAFGGDLRFLARRVTLTAQLTSALNDGRPVRAGWPPPLIVESVIGAVTSVIYARLHERPPASFVDLLRPLMAVVLLPYRGMALARRELARPLPEPVAPPSPPPPPVTNPLEGLSFRFTYRTLCVLDAIADRPGASNREVAQSAGVKDQGQISKLLSRLKRLGLIADRESRSPGRSRNAWRLTARGTDVHRMMLAELGRAQPRPTRRAGIRAGAQ